MKLWTMILLWIRTTWNLPITRVLEDPIHPLEMTPTDRELLERRAQQFADMKRAAGVPIAAIDDWAQRPVVIGIDWANGCDITVYSCGSCGFETGIVEEIVKHAKAHGATRLTVIPATRPAAYRR